MDRLLEATYDAEQRHFWFRGFRWFVRAMVERAAAGRRDLEILDAGCGTGANLSWLSAYGRAVGFDLTLRGLQFARRHGHRVAQGSITGIPYRTASFDLVTSFDVLQCLTVEEEREAVGEIARVLRPGGAAVINVSALEILRGHHAEFGRERRRYTRRLLRGPLEAGGFRVDRITYTNTSLFPLVFATRMVQRYFTPPHPERAGREMLVPPAPVNAVLSALLKAESVVQRVAPMPVGSSVLCLAYKQATGSEQHAVGSGR